MQRLGGMPAQLAQRIAVEDVCHDAERDTAGRCWWHRDDAMTAIRECYRVAPLRAVTAEIVLRDDAAAACHLGDDQVRGLALVEPLWPLVGDALQHASEVRIAPAAASLQRLTAREEQRTGADEAAQPRFRAAHRSGERGIDDEAVACELDRGREDLCPWQRAQLAMRFVQSHHRPWDA